MRALLVKAGFVLRYLWALAWHYPRLRMEGFVFLEPGVSIKVDRGCSIVIGNRAYLKRGCVIECSGQGRMTIGSRVGIGNYAYMGCRDRMEMGEFSYLGQGAVLDVKHLMSRRTVVDGQGYFPGKCLIGKRCIVFPYATVGPNVTIADDSFILNYSVVTHDITESGKIWGGIPAKLKKEVHYDDLEWRVLARK